MPCGASKVGQRFAGGDDRREGEGGSGRDRTTDGGPTFLRMVSRHSLKVLEGLGEKTMLAKAWSPYGCSVGVMMSCVYVRGIGA